MCAKRPRVKPGVRDIKPHPTVMRTAEHKSAVYTRSQDSALSERLVNGAYDFVKGVMWTIITKYGETPILNKNKVAFW